MSELNSKEAKQIARRQHYIDEARANPARYKRRIKMLALIAVLVPMLFLFGFTSLLVVEAISIMDDKPGTFLSSGLRIPMILVVVSLLSVLWVRHHEPEGEEVFEADLPTLFEMIEEVRLAADGPKVDRVFIDADLNACITQPPKGWKVWQSENHLTLGLPLLDLLSVEETKAVIAHEYGHFCAGDGRLGNWLYRAGLAIGGLQSQYEEEGASFVELPLYFFVTRFGERFLDRIFPLMREQEYAADALAARITHPVAIASGLQRMQIGAHFLAKDHHQNMIKRMVASPVPSTTLTQSRAQALSQVEYAPKAGRWLNAALLEEGDYEDTHPALKDRLYALGVQPFYPQVLTHRASELLGHFRPELSRRLDLACQSNFEAGWAHMHEQGKAMIDRYQSLLTQAQTQCLSLEDSLELVDIASIVLDQTALYGNLNYLLTQHGQSAQAWIRAGDVLLADGNPQCIDYLNHAANLNRDMLGAVHDMMVQHYREMGDLNALRSLAA